jgi:hypothetical protein
MLNLNNLLFHVDPDNEHVTLCYGPLSVEVCDSPKTFDKFVERLNVELQKISTELYEEYTDSEG